MFIDKSKKTSSTKYIILVSILFLALFGSYKIITTRAMNDSGGVYKIAVVDVMVKPAADSSNIKRATVELKLKNIGNDVLQVSPGLQMMLVTDAGKIYNMTARYLNVGQAIGGPLLSDNSVDMAVDYDIPSNEKPTSFIYQPDNSMPKTEIGL